MTRYCCPKFMSPNPQTNFRDAKSFSLILVSAENLPYFRRLSGRPMEVYGEVSLDGGGARKSEVDSEGGENPTWNFEVNFPVTESTRKKGGNLVVNLYRKRSVVGHKFMGAVKIKVESLFEKWLDYENAATARVEGTLNGSLSITYSFGICG